MEGPKQRTAGRDWLAAAAQTSRQSALLMKRRRDGTKTLFGNVTSMYIRRISVHDDGHNFAA